MSNPIHEQAQEAATMQTHLSDRIDSLIQQRFRNVSVRSNALLKHLLYCSVQKRALLGGRGILGTFK